MNKHRTSLLKLIASVAIAQSAGLIGSLFTIDAVRIWYPSLVKPPLNPPSWVFGPVWTILYTMMGVALYLVWVRADRGKLRTIWLSLFGVHLVANALWSILFFGQYLLLIAFVDIALLWMMIVALIVLAWRFERRAAWLLMPYLAWVSFASYLNLSIWLLNS